MKIEIVSSPIERTSGMAKPGSPIENFADLLEMDRTALAELGFVVWGHQRKLDNGEDDKLSPVLMLFPGEWYGSVPDGFPVFGLRFEAKTFPDECDDGIRFGCLAFGLVVAA